MNINIQKNAGNLKKMIEISEDSWAKVNDSGLLKIRARYTDTNKIISDTNHEFINLCSCSYLGLDRNKNLIKGAIEALNNEKTLLLPTSRARLGLKIIDEAEKNLSKLFNCNARVTVSCSAASSGLLPLIASGFITNNKKPIMIFDKFAHFSMAHMKSACANETEVITSPHNDVDFLEEICKKNRDREIIYIADGAYSMGGFAPIKKLKELQENYGLYLYFDDSHSISAYGVNGIGYVLTNFGKINSKTIIVSSLGKAFGVSGGVILTSFDAPYEKYINVYAGPQIWSQTLNVPSLGAVINSAKLHLTNELFILQNQLQDNIKLFDSLCLTPFKGNGLPIRIIECGNPENAIKMSEELYKKGYYTSAVFFPIVEKGRGGIRIMIRADLSQQDIKDFINNYNQILNKINL